MIGSPLRHFTECASTNDEAANWAKQVHDRAPHGAVVVADAQTQGRGRQGRVWHSPPGENLYVSVVLRPKLPMQKLPPLTICAGLAVCEVVNSLGVEASIKWPNDVYVGDRKLAGILTEMSTRSHGEGHVVIGIGLNVNSQGFPSELKATSLRLESGAEHDRKKVLGALLVGLDSWVERYCEEGVAMLSEAFAAQNWLRGKAVEATVKGETVRGEVAGLGEDGSLVLRGEGGQEFRVIAGEVVPLG